MKRITIRIGTWHHRLATVYSDVNGADICAYTRAVITGLFKCAIIVAAVVMVVYPILDTVLWLVCGLRFFDSSWGGPLAVFCLIVAAVGVVATLTAGVKHMWDERPEREPSAVGEMYRSWRDKYCARIQFTADP